MLPSKGYFSNFNCPYFESGVCERPHCHFKHSKKEKEMNSANSQDEGETTDQTNAKNHSLIKQLVQETVKQVLNRTDIREKGEGVLDTSAIVNDVVSTLSSNPPPTNTEKAQDSLSDTQSLPSYRPTPISELTRRHIPVQYAPTKPTNNLISRRLMNNTTEKNTLAYTPSSRSYLSDTNTYKPTVATYVPDNITYSPTNATYAPSKLSSLTTTTSGGYKPKSIYEKDSEDDRRSRSISPLTYIPSQIVHDNTNAKKEIDDLENDETEEINENKDKDPVKNISDEDSLRKDDENLNSPEIYLNNELEDSGDNELEDEIIILTGKPDDKYKKNKRMSSDHQQCKKLKTSHKSNSDKSHTKSDSTKEKITNEKSNKKLKQLEQVHLLELNNIKTEEKLQIKAEKVFDKNDTKLSPKRNEEIQTNRNVVKEELNSVKTKNTIKKEDYLNKGTRRHENHRSSSPKKIEKHSKKHLDIKSNITKKKTHDSRYGDIKKSHSSEKSISKSHKTKVDNKLHSSSTSSKSSSNHLHKKTSSNSDSHKIKSPTNNKDTEYHKKKSTSDHYKYKQSHNHKNECPDSDKNRRKNDESKITEKRKWRQKEKKDLFKSENKSHETDEENEISSSSDVELIPDKQAYIVINDSSSNSSSDHITESLPNDDEDNGISSPVSKKRKLIISGGALPSLQAQNASSTSPAPNTLCERWRKAREHVQKANLQGKLRISSVPNVSSILNAKDRLLSMTQRPPPEKSSSVDEVKPNMKTRIAHKPSTLEYPKCANDPEIKINPHIRQICLNTMYETFAQFFPPADAKEKAVASEIHVAKKSHITKIYQNSMAVAVLKIRKNQGVFKELEKKDESQIDESVTPQSVPDYTYGLSLYECYLQYTLNEKDYVENGFPLSHPTKKGCAYIEKSARRATQKQPEDPNLRICLNCSLHYYVDDQGFPVTENDCSYHWGRLFKFRAAGSIQEKYRCCNAEAGSEPCTSARYHVCSTIDEDCLDGFVTTTALCAQPQVYALDCEMCITKTGYELARCTLISLDGKIVLDSTVLPSSPILDYCTRFSGITEKMIKDCTTTFSDLREKLLKLVYKNTIILGHSLENDFKALKIIHRTVVDTSVVFPHRLGLPYKLALRTLVKEKLNLSIQDKESGHDSKEDAEATLKLMMWKIKEDAKKRKPRVIISLDHKN